MSCSECQKKGQQKFSWMMVMSIEIVIVSVYGHVKLFELISDYLKNFF